MNCLLWLLPQLRLRELSVLWPPWWAPADHDAPLVAPFSLSLAKSQPEKSEAASDNEAEPRFMSTPMRRTRSPCCARTASGHAIAAPPSSVMKSRRFTAASRASDRKDSTPQLRQETAALRDFNPI